MKTYLDDTRTCPQCGATLTRFTYSTKRIANFTQQNDWVQMKKVSTWTEIPEDGGFGYMCKECYKKRKIRFWIIFSVIFAILVACVVVGSILQQHALTLTGLGAIALAIVISGSKSGKEFFDLGEMTSRKVYPAREFLHYLLKEHPEVMQNSQKIYAEEK